MDQNYNVNNKRENDEIEIDLMEIFMVLMRWIWVIAAAAAIGGLVMLIYSKFFITPTYESTTRIIVLNTEKNDDLSLTDLQLGTQLTGDYTKLITSRYVVEKVIEQYDLDTTYESFVKLIEVSTTTNTRIIDITLTDTDPLMAKEMVDTLRNIAAERIKEVMAIEAVKYYGGSVAGVASIFATTDNISGINVKSVFNPNDIGDYATYPSHECPLCRAGNKVDALVNYHGYSKL